MRAFRLGYVELGTAALESQQNYLATTLGAVLSGEESGRSYFSLGLDHHNVVLQHTDRTALLAIGLWVANATTQDIASQLKGHGLHPETMSDAHPGIPEMVALDAPGGVRLHLFTEMAHTAPGFAKQGVGPVNLGHLAVASPEAPALVSFLGDVLGFRTTDWIDGLATFMTCNHEHHVLNIIHAPVYKLHHIAFGLRDSAHHYQAVDMLAGAGLPIVWGPSRHTAGHNYASYHFDPSGNLIELFSDMDIFIPELNCFEPRPWHSTLPQRPQVWPADELSSWGTKYNFDFTSVFAI